MTASTDVKVNSVVEVYASIAPSSLYASIVITLQEVSTVFNGVTVNKFNPLIAATLVPPVLTLHLLWVSDAVKVSTVH
jgi:hypothetical protein